tara:strand:+ start:1063 stop:1275 length:213 start_codon:yes stop_codon:yes gene_type:complete
MITKAITADEINQHYKACLDSIAVLMGGETNREILTRNIEHLNIMSNKSFWTEDRRIKINEVITTYNLPF